MKIIKNIPLIFSVIFKHFISGPPQTSWNLKLHLTIKLLQTHFASYSGTIEEFQQSCFLKNYKIPSYAKIVKIFILHDYRINAQAYIEKLVKPYEIVIDPIWKFPGNHGINGELFMNKDWNFNEENNWEKEKIVIFLHGGTYCAGNLDYYREILCELSKISGAHILAIEYRLAPQQPFPAALCDV